MVSQIDRTERLAKNPDQMVNAHVLIHQEEEDSEVDSVIGKEHGSSEDEYDGMMDEDGPEEDDDAEDEEENALAGSFVRLRNGAGKQGGRNLQVDEESSGDDEDDDDEEMDVSD